MERKVNAGNIRGAVKILASAENLAPFSPETLAALRLKHPPALQEPVVPAQPPVAPPSTTPLEVSRTIRAFPSDSAGGPDGLRPDHLKDLTHRTTGTAGTDLLEALSRLVNRILAGEVPKEVCPVLFGATLVALNKKGGGIRPIAVRSVLRRTAGKLACLTIIEDLRPLLQPHQLGFATESACEVITHAVRKLLSPTAYDPNQVLCEIFAKYDFFNAFNTLFRSATLAAAHEDIPALFAFVAQAYGAPSDLFFGDSIIKSEEGLQQGDPLAPALFCLAINKLVCNLKCRLNAWYLDDGGLGGSAKSILRDTEEIIRGGEEIGLRLNPNKCELIIVDGSDQESVQAIFDLLPGVKILKPGECHLLGAPITEEALRPALEEKIEAITLLVERLPSLQSHTALFLLKNCLAIPKLVYTLRSSPAWQASDLLDKFDRTMRLGLEKIINVTLDDNAWLQASLPVSRGGIGIRSAQSLSIPAFLASTACTAELCDRLLSKFRPIDDPVRAQAVHSWCLTTGLAEEPVSRFQKSWDIPVLDAQSSQVSKSVSTPEAEARLLASLRKESGAWLTALPSPNLGTLLDNNAVRIAVCLRLGTPICHPHTCHCGTQVDKFGSHGLSCRKKLPGTQSRHRGLNAILNRAFTSVQVSSKLEPEGLSRVDGKAPDGITLIPWSRGKCFVWDATCADTLCKSYIQASSRAAGSAAATRENHKRRTYAFLGNNYIFCPFAVETMGTFGEDALALVQELGKRRRQITGEPRSRLFLTQRISIEIQRGNCISILATLPSCSNSFTDIDQF